MLKIKKISDRIKEELCDAKWYAEEALKSKEDDKVLAETFYTLATEELKHMELLHAQVVRLINEYKAQKGDPPADMQARYDYIHEEEIEKVKEVKILLAIYKG